jgi:hypothetical protein
MGPIDAGGGLSRHRIGGNVGSRDEKRGEWKQTAVGNMQAGVDLEQRGFGCSARKVRSTEGRLADRSRRTNCLVEKSMCHAE